MSREEKITKLCRAVRAYRGVAQGKDQQGKVIWRIPPKPAERPRVVTLLHNLEIDTKEMEMIDALENLEEFRQWVETIR